MNGVSAAVHILFVLLSFGTIVWALRAEKKRFLVLWALALLIGLLLELKNAAAVEGSAPLFVIYNPSWMLRIWQIPVTVIVGWPAIVVIGVASGMYGNRAPNLIRRVVQWPFFAALYAALVEFVCVITGAWEWVAATPELRRIGMAVGVATIATVVLGGAVLIALVERVFGISADAVDDE